MTKMQKATAWLILILLFVITLWDIFAFIHGGAEATISHLLLSASDGRPIIPFCFGVLMGHLFWPNS